MNIKQFLHQFLSNRIFTNGIHSFIKGNHARGSAHIICIIWSPQLRYSAPAMRSQHGRSSGRRRVPVEPRHSFASRSSLASCQAANWVQAVHDCSLLPTRRNTTLSGRPHHAVCRSDCQSRSQIRHVWLCRSATYHVITWRSLVRCGHSARVEQAAVASSSS